MSEVVQSTERRANRPNSQLVDEIRIVTVPRWKESEMSGDEWRISARIDFYRKGQVVGSKGARDVATAARFVDWFMVSEAENGKIDVPDTLGNFCDQEGCCKPWTVRYRLKERYGRDGKVIPPSKWMEGVIEYRAFCDEHKDRGDCGLDDADRNYEQMDGGRA
ncbi:MAG: hypothetical protein E6Q97_31090 [Desulfurellales bacterium]|nr:MAG: hypothetical protein E6Q97_31090 [Desulfurellales bacterium]